jgi:hypothetical protein
MNDASAARVIRNALLLAKRNRNRIVQGSCGTFSACGATHAHGRKPKTIAICPLCAVLLARDVGPDEPDLDGRLAEILFGDKTPEALDWVLSFFQGYDGQKGPAEGDCLNGNHAAYSLGKRLWKKMGDEDVQAQEKA